MSRVQPFRPGGESIFRRRLLIGLGVLVVVALLAGLGARLAGGGHRAHPAATASPSPTAVEPSSSPTTTSSPTSSPSVSGAAAVARPPHTTSPTDFAKAFAQALWTYDTRTGKQGPYLNGLHLWLTGESQYADPASIDAQVPEPLLWDRMRDNGQHATGTVAEAHLPSSFQAVIAKDPTALTAAYIYAVTVSGKQAIAWNGGGRGAEDRAITLAVQCRPSHDCALASISTTVYP